MHNVCVCVCVCVCARARAYVCVCVCARARVCVSVSQWKESAGWTASTTSDTCNTSSSSKHVAKKNTARTKSSVLSVDHCQRYRIKKREVCVCHIEKKVPDEWQAQQVIPAILRASNSKNNAKKNTTRIRGKFHQSITAIFTEEKKRGNLPNLHMLQSACFRT